MEPSQPQPGTTGTYPPRTSVMEKRIRDEYGAMDHEPGFISAAESILKQPGKVLYELVEGKKRSIATLLLALSSGCLLAYGLTVGLFSGGHQIWVAPAKLLLGVLLSSLICLPSLVIFSCLAGSRNGIGDTSRLLVGAVTLISLLLVGFGPVSWVFSQSTDSVAFMAHLHVVFWIIGLAYGLRFLTSAVSVLDGGRSGHLVLWCFIFVLVSLQMMTTLRPIVGTGETFFPAEKQFFLQHWCTMMGQE